MREILGRLKYYAAVVLFLLMSTVLSSGQALMATGHAFADSDKVTICHATASGTNPYVSESVDISSLGDAGHGSSGINSGDIVPPTAGTNYPNGQNWDATGQSIYNNGCTAPTSVTSLQNDVTFTEPTCDTAGFYTIPTKTGVTYEDALGNVLAAGNHSVLPGQSVTIKAVAASSAYVLTGYTTWTHTFTTPSNCIIPPVTLPAVPTTPTVTTAASCSLTTEVVTPPTIAGVVWSPSTATTLAPGQSVTYTATPANGYNFPNNVTYINFTLTNMFNTASCNQAPQKVYVCKYVGTPGVDERLQTGQNPIDVSVNAIAENPVTVGSYFNDAQGRSYVLAFDVGQTAPDASACPSTTVHTVTPAAVTFTYATCANPSPLGSYTIPTTTGVVYEINGSQIAASTYYVTVAGTVTVNAVAANSAYALSGTTQWSASFSVPNGCGSGGPINPNITGTPGACVATVLPIGTATITVMNPNNFSVDYLVDLGGQEQALTVDAGQTGQVTFTGLAAGTYTVNVRGDDDTMSATSTVAVEACPVTPPSNGGGGGHVLGASTTVNELANTGTSTVLPTILAISMALTATGVMLGDYMRRKSAVSDPTL